MNNLEKKFEPNSLDNQEVIKRERKKDKENKINKPISRREFLKTAGIFTAGVAAGGLGLNSLGKEKKQEEKNVLDSEVGNFSKEEKDEELEQEEMIIREQEVIKEEEIKSIDEVINFDSPEPIKFNIASVKALEKQFAETYRGRLKPSLEYAFREMGAWEPDLREIFKKEGVPEKFIYLAIPESHWKFSNRSIKGADGPYQFIRRTARRYGLRIDETIDERKDPLKSARACAKLLHHLHRKTGDWDLDLSLYNGGFAWKYLEEAARNKEEVSYKKYLGYIEERLNSIKDSVKEAGILTHTVGRGDTLSKIAASYQIDMSEIYNLNRKKIKDKNRIRRGGKFVLPTNGQVRRKVFLQKISGFKENLSYPAKFNAVMKLINEGFVTEQKKPLKYKTITVSRGREIKYTIKPKDTLYSISKKLGVAIDVLRENNPGLKIDSLPIGYNLKISGNKPTTLFDIARKERTFLWRLKKLNPAIKESKRPIPDGFEIRV